MLWNFQCVKCLDKHVQQDYGRKSGVERQHCKKGFKTNLKNASEHACSVEGVLVVLDLSASPYLKVTSQTRKIQNLSKLLQVQK